MHINTEYREIHNAHKCRMYTVAQCTQIQIAHDYSAQLVSNRASVGNCHLASSLPPCHSRSHTFHSESFTLFNLPQMLFSIYFMLLFNSFTQLPKCSNYFIMSTFHSESSTLFNLPKMLYSLFLLYAFNSNSFTQLP